jgi:16S rRNA processing protein RimM
VSDAAQDPPTDRPEQHLNPDDSAPAGDAGPKPGGTTAGRGRGAGGPGGAGTTLRRRAPVPSGPPPIPERSPAPEHLIIGRILAAHGVRGEFRMAVITNHPDHLTKIRTVFLGEEHEQFRASRIRPHPNGKEALVKLAGLDSPEEAAERRGQLVRIALADAPPLPEGEYYHYQLLGIDAVDEAGTFLGRLAEIIETGSNDVYVVRGPAGEVLLPVIEGVILSVDPDAGRMVVRQPDYY